MDDLNYMSVRKKIIDFLTKVGKEAEKLGYEVNYQPAGSKETKTYHYVGWFDYNDKNRMGKVAIYRSPRWSEEDSLFIVIDPDYQLIGSNVITLKIPIRKLKKLFDTLEIQIHSRGTKYKLEIKTDGLIDIDIEAYVYNIEIKILEGLRILKISSDDLAH